jgi:hypothetical protein
MRIVPMMWSVWGALVLLLTILKLYNARLVRDEDDQLVLDDAFSQVKIEQEQLMTKIHKIEPLVRIAFALVIVATLWVVGYYALDMISQLK